MISLIRGLKQQESGQALVEFALVLPLFILLLFGLIEMSIIGYSYISLNNAARTGVRLASVGVSDDDIGKAIENLIILNKSTLIPVILPLLPPEKQSLSNQRQSGKEVTVDLSYQVPLIVPIVEGIFPNPFIIRASLTMRLE